MEALHPLRVPGYDPVQPYRRVLLTFVLIPLLLIIVALKSTYLYNNLFLANSTPFTFNSDYEQAAEPQEGQTWEIQYEGAEETTYTGRVRHISLMKMNKYPLLSHDILVTNGDYANPSIVWTNVTNHRFYWRSKTSNLDGSLNLLHAVPANHAIYNKLINIQPGDSVTIRGREILRIVAHAPDGKPSGAWQDDGCNTILITAVE